MLSCTFVFSNALTLICHLALIYKIIWQTEAFLLFQYISSNKNKKHRYCSYNNHVNGKICIFMVLSYVEGCGMEPVMYLGECTDSVVVFCMTDVLILYLDICRCIL